MRISKKKWREQTKALQIIFDLSIRSIFWIFEIFEVDDGEHNYYMHGLNGKKRSGKFWDLNRLLVNNLF